MANICSTIITYKGETNTLEQLLKTFTKENEQGTALSFQAIEHFIPQINNHQLFQSLGWNYIDYITNKLSPENLNKIHQELNGLFEKNNWIGLRDDYFNYTYDFSSTLEKEQLTLHISFPNYAPIDFFTYFAKSEHLSLTIVHFIEGDCTKLTYYEKDKKQYNTDRIDLLVLFENKTFRELSISEKLVTPTEILLGAIYYKENQLAKDLISQYSLNSKDLDQAYIEQTRPVYFDIYNSDLFCYIRNMEGDSFNTRLKECVAKANVFITENLCSQLQNKKNIHKNTML